MWNVRKKLYAGLQFTVATVSLAKDKLFFPLRNASGVGHWDSTKEEG